MTRRACLADGSSRRACFADGLSRRGFLGFLFALFVFVMGCGKKETPRSVEKPPVIPTPAPPQPDPAPELKFAKIPDFSSRDQKTQQAPPSAKQESPNQNIVFVSRNEDHIAEVVRGSTGKISNVVQGTQKDIAVDMPPSEQIRQLKMEFRSDPVIGREKHLVLSEGGSALHSVMSGGNFIFKNEKNQTLMDVSGTTPKPLRFGLDQIREGFKNPEKLQGLMRVGTQILAIAIFVWLGAKIAIVLLAGIAFLAFLGVLLGLLGVSVGPAFRALKILLKEAGISDEQIEHFLERIKKIVQQVLKEALSELRKIPKLANA